MKIFEMLRADIHGHQKKKRKSCWDKCKGKKKDDKADDDKVDEHGEALDNIDMTLNPHLVAQKNALVNWKKLKFRLLVISKFSSLKVLR